MLVSPLCLSFEMPRTRLLVAAPSVQSMVNTPLPVVAVTLAASAPSVTLLPTRVAATVALLCVSNTVVGSTRRAGYSPSAVFSPITMCVGAAVAAACASLPPLPRVAALPQGQLCVAGQVFKGFHRAQGALCNFEHSVFSSLCVCGLPRRAAGACPGGYCRYFLHSVRPLCAKCQSWPIRHIPLP